MEKTTLPICIKSWKLKIHAFRDASFIGKARVLFLLRHNSNKAVIESKFSMGKSKVAPIKQLSAPNLELEAATIGARLLSFASEELHLNRTAVVDAWRVCQVVLDWIN